MLKKEKNTKLNTFSKSIEYRSNVKRISSKLRKIVIDIKKRSNNCRLWGCKAKGLTILKCSKLGKKEISYFVDDSPAKQGLYTPVDHIPIISRKEANKNLPDYFIILAPNYSDVIIKKKISL